MDTSSPSCPPSVASATGPVLLFDGDCGLCNRIVRLLLRMDRHGKLLYAPLQGPTAQAYLRAHDLPTRDFHSLVFVPAWERRDSPAFRLRTDGALAALASTGGTGRCLAGLARMVPARGRDAAYRAVARWRYRLFGEWRPRPLPRPEWQTRFLD